MSVLPAAPRAPAGVVVPDGRPARGCSVHGCGRRHYARGFCHPHWLRVRRRGDHHADVPIGARASTGTSYCSVRRRLRAEHGPASARRCAVCARRGWVWSYDGTDPDEHTDPARGYRYSLDLTRYRPRCRSCHRRASGPGGAGPLDVERAARLYRGGASSRGIGALLDASPSAVLRALRTHGVPIRDRGRARR